MAHGSIGDVVFRRRNGRQVESVRVRRVSNPQSVEQKYQRTIMQTALQAYRAGSVIFDHSFEGCTTPKENMSRFMSLNSIAMRTALTNGGTRETNGLTASFRFCAPNTRTPVPSLYTISDGSLPSNSEYFGYLNSHPWEFGVNPDLFASRSTLRDFLEVWPFGTDDYFTICIFNPDFNYYPVFTCRPYTSPNHYVECFYQLDCNFWYFRFSTLPRERINLEMPLADAMFSDLFNFETNSNNAEVAWNDGFSPLTAGFTSNTLCSNLRYVGASGIIFSQKNRKKRSKCIMQLYNRWDDVYNASYGLSGGFILPAWEKYLAGSQLE